MREKLETERIIFDSGAEVTAFKSMPYSLEVTDSKPQRNLIYGNNGVSKVFKIGALGGLKDIHISNDLVDNIVSISKLCKHDYTAIFNKDNMFLIKKDCKINVDGHDVALIAKRVGGIYVTSMESLLNTINEDIKSVKHEKSSYPSSSADAGSEIEEEVVEEED